jgi:hypothetical protein
MGKVLVRPLGLLVLFAASASAQFDAPIGTLYPAGQLYEAQVIHNLTRGDMDNDGELDFVFAARNDTVFLTDDGAGGLTAKYMGGNQAGALRGINLFDWNGDGTLDVGAAKADAPASVWLGSGSGLVTSSQFLHGEKALHRDVISGDLDDDGNVDALFAGQDPQYVRVFFGDGRGGIKADLQTPTQSGVARLATLDLDLDGDLDVLAATNAHIRPMLNDGVGDLTPIPLLDNDGAPRDIVVRDLDGDGRGEVALTTANPDQVTIYDVLGQGDLVEVGAYATGDLPRRSLFGDLDGDGEFDMVVPVRLSHRVEIRRGLGGNQFDSQPTHLPMAGQPMGAILDDRNGDGLLDLLVGLGSSDTPPPDVTVMLGTGVGSFELPATVSAVGSVVALDVGDMDGDGHPDVVTAEDNPNRLAIYRNAGQYSLDRIQALSSVGEVRDVAVGDISGDGIPDAVVAYLDLQGGLGVFKGEGDGTVLAPVRVPFESFSRQVGLSDLDGDGDLDAVLATQDQASVGVLIRHPLDEAPLTLVSQHLLSFSPEVMVLGDLSGDGADDVAVATSTSIESLLLINRETELGFDGVDALPPLPGTLAMGFGDADGDGDLDIAVAQGGAGGSQLRVLANDGDLGFTVGAVLETPATPYDVHVDDLDEDGHQDLLTTAISVIMVHHGKGAGVFAPPQMYSAGGTSDGASVFDAVPVDVDGDRHLDVVLGGSVGYVSILPNRLSPWWNVGGGATGGPVLRAQGPLTPGDEMHVEVEEGTPFDVAWIVSGLSPVLEPAGDGVLVPALDDVFPLVLDEQGAATFPIHVSAGLPVGLPFWVQAWDVGREESVIPSDGLLGIFE